MSTETDTLDKVASVKNNFIGLEDFRTEFSPDVEEFFSQRIGRDEFSKICKLSCQAPPYIASFPFSRSRYTSIRVNLLATTREKAVSIGMS